MLSRLSPTLLATLAVIPLTAACGAAGEGQVRADQRAPVIRIMDSWMGLSPASPQRASFQLRLTDEGGYVGTGSYSVGPKGPHQLRDSAEIRIPASAADSFYAIIGHLQAEPGTYEPSITHTDDYPNLSIELVSGSDTVRLYSGSQGHGHVPWGMERDGLEYVVDSPLPFEALEQLRPHLRMDRLQKLFDSID